ncbi:sphingomyelin phosphodiesterase 4-like isoform X2 [Homarus americanus]|uniref:sphingomyelin phosphodiesterase 4-like isoform X2 n=1 Tax=Homarus americanus TaxID=6706 RepID=UPI001C471000|nr:sphingomyelin phosphodiesterase 4-like isoform X2 [Homarus americanus]
MYTNMAATPLSLSIRLQNAISQPILQVRCEEVGRILNESTSKDASFILRSVVESIFGLGGQVGWGLRTITHSALSREFEQLRVFLSASGPLLSLTYRLANDPFLMFEFPVAWLPVKSRAEIEDGTPGLFYVNKVQNPGLGKTPTNILLNAFEFYIFHFAHFLVSGSNHRWSLSWSTAGDALYPSLLEDYLSTFLPCDSSIPPGPPSPPVTPRGVLSPVSPRGSGAGSHTLYLSTLVSPIAARPLRSPAPHGYPGIEGSGAHASSPLHATHNPHPQLNIWTSQVLLQVVMEMWVNQCLTPPTRSPGRILSSTQSSPHSGQEVFVPSSDHVRVVRMLIKHLHFFANSGKSAQPSPLDDLRKNLWNMYRKSLYQFLRHTFSHWPLDSSFRLVLETWLSYVQPWRYIDYSPTNRSPAQGATEYESQRSVEGKWQGFIAENLLFYTLLFYHLMCRLFRLDLSAPKNAQILFRVTKVFSQTNLSNFVREIEEALEDPHFMHRSLLGGTSHSLRHHGGFAGIHNDQFPARSLASVARGHIVEMEGPSHTYHPMFSSGNITMVESLLKHIRRAYEAVVREQHQQHLAAGTVSISNGTNGKVTKEGWFTSLIKGIFDAASPTEDETSTDDIRKTVIHLETAQRQLSGIFNILQPLEYGQTLCGIGPGHHGTSQSDTSYQHHQVKSSDDPTSPQCANTPSGPMLTNYGRYQLKSGLCRRDLKYDGDPDLKPICTFEIPFLVRWLYSLTMLINSKYGTDMIGLYSREDIVGYFAKLILKAPETVYEYHKNSSGSPHTRVAKHLPPRISLRFQASKHAIGYELAFAVVFYILGLWSFFIKMLISIFIIIAVPAYICHRFVVRPRICEEEEDHEEQQQDQLEQDQHSVSPALSVSQL